jgi:hypothetical protein
MIEASEISKATDAYLRVRKAELIAEAKAQVEPLAVVDFLLN